MATTLSKIQILTKCKARFKTNRKHENVHNCQDRETAKYNTSPDIPQQQSGMHAVFTANHSSDIDKEV